MAACVFCRIIAGELPSSRFYEDDRLLGFMDIYPWRPGHALVIPKAHHQRMTSVEPTDGSALWLVAQRVASALRRIPELCDDVHFLLNDGAAANQTVPHVHLHVIPRVRGDLPRLVMQLAGRPLVPVRRPVATTLLDRHAAAIRAGLKT